MFYKVELSKDFGNLITGKILFKENNYLSEPQKTILQLTSYEDLIQFDVYRDKNVVSKFVYVKIEAVQTYMAKILQSKGVLVEDEMQDFLTLYVTNKNLIGVGC